MTTNEVVTFGCRLNIYESEIIKNNLSLANLEQVIVFNTCAVTNQAEKDAVQAIKKARKNDPNVKIFVTGCAVQSNPDLFANMPEVNKLIGNEEKLSSEFYQLDGERIIVKDIMQIKETANHLVSSFDGKSRAFLQVQNGCDHRCTYCSIPFGRGNNRSVPIGVIVSHMKHLVDNGYNEVVITGVDVTSYGSDLPGKPTFAQMITRVLNLVPDLKRLRLSSIDIAEIDDELFELIAYSPRLMPHIHISLQSGDNMILKRMKRRHNRQQVIDFCHKLRSIRKDVSFGADIITGFPTETDEMFNNTLNLVSEADLQYLHIFPYSERRNTPAARMPQVPMNIRKNRAKELRMQGQVQLQKFFAQNIDSKVNLLLEKNNFAHTENFIPTKIINSKIGVELAGQIVSAKLVSIGDNHMNAIIEL